MKYAWLGCLLFGGLLSAGNQDSEFNVNSRYTVETVVISGEGWRTDLAADHDREGKLSSVLRKDVSALIGEKLNSTVLDEVGKRLRKEFHARTVEHKVLRGRSPEYVQVVYDVELRPTRFDVSVPKFLYSSKSGWNGEVEGTTTLGHNGFTVGAISNSDEMIERYAGIVARYENNRLGSDHLHFRFAFEDYHEQWNQATRDFAATHADETSGLYRTRRNLEPELTFAIARPLTVSVGTSFQSFQEQFPAAQTESANALITTLRYHRRLGSDFVYARHRWEFRYMLTRGRNVVIDDLTAGMISGRAPLFERFSLGNGSTLRGWNKYELDPLGGNRMVHNSVEYRYGAFQIFYDSGAVWDRNDAAVLRHAAGVGLRQGVFSLAVAFPLREGHIDPVFMVGMNY
jgi:hypothetical protein